MQITRLRYTRLDYSALGFLYSTYNAGVRYKALSSVLFPIPNTLCRRCFIVVLSAMGKHLEISEWANYRTVGTEVVGGGLRDSTDRLVERERTAGHGVTVGILVTSHYHLTYVPYREYCFFSRVGPFFVWIFYCMHARKCVCKLIFKCNIFTV